MSTLFTTLDIAASGMNAQRTRINIAATNLANKSTTRTPEGGPYRRRDVVLAATEIDPYRSDFARTLDGQLDGSAERSTGVRVAEIVATDDPPLELYDPGHPDADGRGYVRYPDVSSIKEMVNLMGASRAYQAGATVMRTVKQMAEGALRIGR
jgi:flagellar basal-body rod protein FlgC